MGFALVLVFCVCSLLTDNTRMLAVKRHPLDRFSAALQRFVFELFELV